MTGTADFSKILENQKSFLYTGETLSAGYRKNQLKEFYNAVKKYEPAIIRALKDDLSKPEFESYTNEIGIVYSEIRHILKNLDSWMKRKKSPLEIFMLPGEGYIYSEPYGSVLIISPWNYPFQLLAMPLASAMAAGNTAILKPSELSPASSEVFTELVKNHFDPGYIAVINGGPGETEALLKLKFDRIFFTGSTRVGKIVMKAAAENLIPVTLELGGKSPVIVDESADLKHAARKIVWGKFNNAGQTCVAPDYILAEKSVSSRFKKLLCSTITDFFGENPADSRDYGRIINNTHFERVVSLIESSKVISGGTYERQTRYIAPTIMENVAMSDKVMGEEIFGPVLPVIDVENIEEALRIVRSLPRPLALYLFTGSKKREKQVMEQVSFGGGGINTTLMHVASSYLPLGGIGQSGTGSYHGKAGFDEFTHYKSVFRQPSWPDPGIAYPGRQLPLSLIKKILR